jgi:urocanate hydratase
LNNFDPEVAEKREELNVNVGSRKGARNPECLEAILASLERLGDVETLPVRFGKSVGVSGTQVDTPRVLSAKFNLVSHRARGTSSAGSRLSA